MNAAARSERIRLQGPVSGTACGGGAGWRGPRTDGTNSGDHSARADAGLTDRLAAIRRRDWPWLLVLAYLVVLPAGNVFHGPILIMAAAGAVLLARAPALRRDPGLGLLAALFACAWLPMLASLADAVEPGRATETTLSFLRFPLAGAFVLWALRSDAARRRLAWGIAAVAGFWCLDALWQFASGTDFFGFPRRSYRLSGIFHPKGRLGLVLAVLAPILFELIRRLQARWRFAWLLTLPLALVVVASGSRNAWIMLALAVGGYLAYLACTGEGRARRRTLAVRGALVLVLCLAAASQYPKLGARLLELEGLFSADVEAIDVATKRRVSIWRPALSMVREHWANGVGPRGFRYAFRAHAAPDNFWLTGGNKGVTHPHMMLLEVATETGALGVAGYALMLIVAAAALLRLPRGARAGPVPWGLAAGVALFPLNTHMALYGSFWSTLAWWLVMLFVAEVSAARRRPGVRS